MPFLVTILFLCLKSLVDCQVCPENQISDKLYVLVTKIWNTWSNCVLDVSALKFVDVDRNIIGD